MNNSKKIILTVFAASVLLVCMCVFSASALNDGPYVYEIDNGEVTITGCDREQIQGDIVIPQTLGGIPVTGIGEKAFYYCNGITSVLIDDNIKSIGKSAFAFCGAISEVILPNTVEEIPDEAFYMCFNLSKVNLSKTNIKRIGAKAFGYCEFIQTITLPDTLETVGEEAFNWCSSIQKVIIGKGINEISASAFSKCYELRDIYYMGTQEEFSAVSIAEGNSKLTDAFFFFEHEHEYGKGKQIIKGNCLAKGRTEFTCSKCGDSYYNLKFGNHIYKDVIKKATFKADGLIESKCSICSNIKKTTVIPKVTAKLAKTAYAYTGKAISPAVTVKPASGTALTKDTDFTVSYSSTRKDLGEYTVTVKLKGDKYTGTSKLTYNIIPGKPTVTVQENTNNIKLTWSKVKGATGYRVYSYNPETKKYTTLKTLSGTSYIAANLKSGTAYTYSVRAYGKVKNETVWGNYSAVDTATIPAKVKLSSASATDAGKTTLKWGKTAADGYEIYMATGTGQYKKIKTVTNSSTVSYSKTLAKGNPYSFIIRAYKTVGDSKLYGDYSNVKSVSIK